MLLNWQNKWTNSSAHISNLYVNYQTLFHRRTRSAYVYNGCLVWYNVVLTPRIHSTVKYSQLGQSANVCDVSKQPTGTLCSWKNCNDNKWRIWWDFHIYPNWPYSTLEWKVELTIRYTTPRIRCRQVLKHVDACVCITPARWLEAEIADIPEMYDVHVTLNRRSSTSIIRYIW